MPARVVNARSGSRWFENERPPLVDRVQVVTEGCHRAANRPCGNSVSDASET